MYHQMYFLLNLKWYIYSSDLQNIIVIDVVWHNYLYFSTYYEEKKGFLASFKAHSPLGKKIDISLILRLIF